MDKRLAGGALATTTAVAWGGQFVVPIPDVKVYA